MPKKTSAPYFIDGDKIERIDYKDIALLKKFVTPAGKIRPRKKTGVSARAQRQIARAVKRARHIALLPFDSK